MIEYLNARIKTVEGEIMSLRAEIKQIEANADNYRYAEEMKVDIGGLETVMDFKQLELSQLLETRYQLTGEIPF